VSVQAQVLNLFLDLKERYQLSYLSVSHELAVERHVSDRVAVMYLGRIVETAARDDLYREPLQPFTQALLGAVAVPDPELECSRPYSPPQGEVPSVFNPPSGCPFHPRCPKAMDICVRERPKSRTIAADHIVACHLYAPV
jgi:oligopeptide/dipeptide ABC transporter ATP-binding protein